jgi:anhydro-N-acetylmuramic acid kinase
MTRAPRVLGLMSGTSADGVDAVLLELNGFPALGAGGSSPPALISAAPRGRVVAHEYTPYPVHCGPGCSRRCAASCPSRV